MKRIISFALALLLLIALLPPLNASASENEKYRYGEVPVVTVLKSETVVKHVKVAGQLDGGIGFLSGGSMYVDTDGGVSTTINIPVSWVTLSLSVKPGKLYSSPVSGGVQVNFPADSNYYHVYCKRTYTVEYVRVDEYRGSEILSTYYLTRYNLDSMQFYLKKVN